MMRFDERENLLYAWVRQQQPASVMSPIPGDASFRRYYRVVEATSQFIAVDSPPTTENNLAFVAVARQFLKAGLIVPEVIQVDYDQGFLLLSDLGDCQLLRILTQENVDHYYQIAMHEMIKMQSCLDFDHWHLPVFDNDLLSEELSRFHYWYLETLLAVPVSTREQSMLQEVYYLLIDSALKQPRVCVHRDFHSRNLMLMQDDRLGVLDFQDAVLGPITYDLVSLLRDCYITWPIEQIHAWIRECYLLLMQEKTINLPSLEEFIKWVDWMGLQRHLKVLGTFARLYKRDGKENYLKDIPRVLSYVRLVLDRYQELTPLNQFLTRVFDESNDTCRRSWHPDEASFR